MTKYIYTIKAADVGKGFLRISKKCKHCGTLEGFKTISLVDFMGYVQKIDIGKRIYDVDGVYQVENQEQLNNRLQPGA